MLSLIPRTGIKHGTTFRVGSQNVERVLWRIADPRFKSTVSVDEKSDKASTASKKDNKAERPSTSWELIKNFPQGVKRLYNDVLRYKNIHDASRTRLNAWTTDSPLRSAKIAEPRLWVYNNEARPGRIPRRQHEQQRRLMQEDLRTVLPLVALWALPFVGYISMVLVVFCPRQVLSRQFLKGRDIQDFAEIEYGQLRKQFPKLGTLFWNSVMVDAKDCIQVIAKRGQDSAGPIFDARLIYQAFATDSVAGDNDITLPLGVLSRVDTYPRDYLVTLALAAGINQNWPDLISVPITRSSPSAWNRSQILRKASDIADDDDLLLDEGHVLNGCASLTDLEVLDACLNRGLPVNVSYEEMRRCLTNHLRMIGEITSQFPDEAETEGFKLFTLHLGPLRQHLKTTGDE